MSLTRVLSAAAIPLSIPTLTHGEISTGHIVMAQYDWRSRAADPFTLTQDAGTGMVTLTLGGVTLDNTTLESGSSVAVTDIATDGESVMDQSQAVGNGLDKPLDTGSDTERRLYVDG